MDSKHEANPGGKAQPNDPLLPGMAPIDEASEGATLRHDYALAD